MTEIQGASPTQAADEHQIVWAERRASPTFTPAEMFIKCLPILAVGLAGFAAGAGIVLMSSVGS